MLVNLGHHCLQVHWLLDDIPVVRHFIFIHWLGEDVKPAEGVEELIAGHLYQKSRIMIILFIYTFFVIMPDAWGCDLWMYKVKRFKLPYFNTYI